MAQIYGYKCKQQKDLNRFCKLLALFHSFLLNPGVLKKNVNFHNMIRRKMRSNVDHQQNSVF